MSVEYLNEAYGTVFNWKSLYFVDIFTQQWMPSIEMDSENEFYRKWQVSLGSLLSEDIDSG